MVKKEITIEVHGVFKTKTQKEDFERRLMMSLHSMVVYEYKKKNDVTFYYHEAPLK